MERPKSCEPQQVVIDHDRGVIEIDGEPVPYWIAESGATTEEWSDGTLVKFECFVFAKDVQVIGKPNEKKLARRLLDAAARLTDALAFARGPRGEVLFLTDDQRVCFAFHLARAGSDVDPGKAIIKRRAIPDRPGQLAGVIDWVPVDTPDDPNAPEPITAVGPIPEPPKLPDLDELVPWQTPTRIEGDFT